MVAPGKSFLSAVDSLNDRGKFSEALGYLETTCKKYPPQNVLDNMILYEIKAYCLEHLGHIKEAEATYEKMDFYAQKLKNVETIKDVATHYSLSPGIFLGTGATDLKAANTDPSIQIERKAALITTGGFVMVGFNSINFGYAFGGDFATGSKSKDWLYQGKMWYGVIFAIDILK